MSRSEQSRSLTFADAAALDADACPGELDGHGWVPMTRGTWRHGRVVVNVAFVLESWAREHPGWCVATADPGTRLGSSPDILRGPDVGVVRQERMPTGTGVEGWLDGAPDLAVEVAGDAQAPSELVRKTLEYLAAGAKLVWVVDPAAEQVVVYRPGNLIEVVRNDGTLDGGDVLPGFRCAVAELFRR